MKLGLAYITQIRGVEDRPGGEDRPAADAPGEATPGVLSVLRGFLALQLTNLVATIGAGYHTEHNLDDTHKTITASGSISEHGRRTPLGEWIPLPFSTLAFVGLGTMTWTVSPTLATIKYMVVGKTVFLVFNIVCLTETANSVFHREFFVASLFDSQPVCTRAQLRQFGNPFSVSHKQVLLLLELVFQARPPRQHKLLLRVPTVHWAALPLRSLPPWPAGTPDPRQTDSVERGSRSV